MLTWPKYWWEGKLSVKMLIPRKLLKTVFLKNNGIIVKIRSTEIPEIIWIPFKCLEPRAEYTVILALSSEQTAAGWRELLSLRLWLTNYLGLQMSLLKYKFSCSLPRLFITNQNCPLRWPGSCWLATGWSCDEVNIWRFWNVLVWYIPPLSVLSDWGETWLVDHSLIIQRLLF